MGIKKVFSSFGSGLAAGIRNIAGAFRDDSPSQPASRASADLAEEERRELERRRRAQESLTQTSTLGAGTPETTRSRVLGV